MSQDKNQDIELGIIRLEYGDASRPQRAVLEIHTGKGYNGGLRSSCTVFWVGGNSRQTALGLGGGGDFSKTLKVSERTVRATQKNIDKQHAEVFTPEAIAELVAAAKAQYAAVVSAGADGYGNIYPAAAPVEEEKQHHSRCQSFLDDPCDCENLRLGDAVVRAAQGGDNA